MKVFKTLFSTFYSYKGGVGRTSALVNSALLRAIDGDRVVVIDFDLESPGVSSYVREIAKKNNKKVNLTRPGILEYLNGAIESEQVPSLKSLAITEKNLGLDISGNIWFIGAGNTSDPEYSKKLGSMNWADIFQKKHGRLLLENFKRQIVEEFKGPDYVFIDSRTGITEIGGVCTRYLADHVVIFSSLNDQNILGTSNVVNSFKKSKIPTILVASNVPVGLPWGEKQLFTERIQKFCEHFGENPNLLIYNYPSLSLMEYLPAFFRIQKDKAILQEDPLLKSYENLAQKIDSKNEHSFNKFLMDIINKLLADRSDDRYYTETFNFFQKHYSNRLKLLKLFKLMQFILKCLGDKSKRKIIESDTIEALRKIKKYDTKIKNLPLNMLKKIILDKAGFKIVEYYNANQSDIEGLKGCFDIIEDSPKVKAVELLVKTNEYKFIVSSFDTNDENGFLVFAKGFAAEKLGNDNLSKEIYEKFLKSLSDKVSDINSAGQAFTCAFAATKLGNIELAKSLLLRAREIIDFPLEEPTDLFNPTRFRDEKDEEIFLKELGKFEKGIELNK